ncbi:MAG TPA: hypothetical protein VGD24_02410 [Gallionella sp.]
MKAIIGVILTLLCVMGVVLDAVAEPELDSDQPPVEYKTTVMLNTGTFNSYKRVQDWQITGPWGCFLWCGYSSSALPNEFDTSSRDVYGIEIERQIKNGWSYGISYFQTRSTFTIPSVSPAQGIVKAGFYFAMFKKYFGDPAGLRPFIGIGPGKVDASLGGYVNSSADGSAKQAVAGLSYQSRRISFVAGYRYVVTDFFSLHNSIDGVGSVYGKMDLSGRGNFVGLGVNFW